MKIMPHNRLMEYLENSYNRTAQAFNKKLNSPETQIKIVMKHPIKQMKNSARILIPDQPTDKDYY